jgi:diguanylate cyclase (GGDEF)-like protein/PAS domain S-box-containing protein
MFPVSVLETQKRPPPREPDRTASQGLFPHGCNRWLRELFLDKYGKSMTFNKNMTIVTRLAIGFSAIIILLISLGVSSLFEIDRENHYVARIRYDWTQRIAGILRLQAALQSVRLDEFHFATAATPAERKSVGASLDRFAANVQHEADEYDRFDGASDPKARMAWADIKRLMPDYLDNDRRIRELVENNQSAEALAMISGPSLKVMAQMERDAKSIVDAGLADGKRDEAVPAQVYSRATQLVTALVAAAVAIAAWVGFVIRRSLMNQLGGEPRELALLASEIAAGNLSVDVPLMAGDRGSLKQSLRIMKDRLAATIQELKHSASRYQMLYESTPAMLYSVDSEGFLMYVSDQWLATTGYKRDEVIGRRVGDFLSSTSHTSELFRVGSISGIERLLTCKDGSVIDTLISAISAPDAWGRPMSLSVVQDVTERNRAQAALLAEHEHLRVILDSIGDGVIAMDRDGAVKYLNAVAEKLTGWTNAQARGLRFEEVFRLLDDAAGLRMPDLLANGGFADSAIEGDASPRLRSRDGQEYSIERLASPLRDISGQVIGAVVVFRDVSERVRMHREMLYRATHDTLTGMLNRDEFERRLQDAVAASQRTGARHALMYIDLDQFKVVNDAGGHAAGDRLLKQVVGLIGRVIRRGDTFARLGGDEFGLLVKQDGGCDPHSIAQRICREIDAFRFRDGNLNLHIGASIGLVLLDDRWVTAASGLQAADSACYAAKAAGRNRVHTYVATDEVIESHRGDMQWVRRLEAALDKGQFVLHWQRICPLGDDDGGLHGEVLLRLVGDDGVLIPPGVFLASAERFQMASRIDRWVLREVFNLMTMYKESSAHLDTVSINLSGQSIGDRNFHSYVLDLIDSMAFDTRKICFEITETAVITNLNDANLFFESMRERGVRFALDDFGSGVSSFGYLKALPVDYLKIDGQFIQGLADDPVGQATVRCISEVARITGKKTVAEFVESQVVELMLRDIGIDYTQGFLRHRPAPIHEMFMGELGPAVIQENAPGGLELGQAHQAKIAT